MVGVKADLATSSLLCVITWLMRR